MIDVDIPHLSIRRQCDLLGLNRSTFYYAPATESEDNLRLMRLIDEQYTKTPFYGWPRMTAHVRRLGLQVNHKRVQRLMQTMGLQAIYPKPRPSAAAKEHTIYPYLLNAVVLSRPNQVWSADITYVRMTQGFMYLVAVIDWYSRYVLAWQLSNTMESTFCLVALERALGQGAPMIFNTDQGVQFTSLAFTGRLARAGIAISMDGRGRAFDNIFIERLWRSVKYEDIYLKDYATVPALDEGLAHYFHFYNHERPHQSLAYRTPAQAHVKQPEDPVSRPPYF
jgi:putative transposase